MALSEAEQRWVHDLRELLRERAEEEYRLSGPASKVFEGLDDAADALGVVLIDAAKVPVEATKAN